MNKGLEITFTNQRKFNAELERFSSVVVPKHFSTMLRWVALETFRRLIMKTPVDTGRARGSWRVSIGSPVLNESGINDRTGSYALGVGASVINRVRNMQTIWLTNSVPYIEKLEQGHSNQAPSGMVSLTMREMAVLLRTIRIAGIS